MRVVLAAVVTLLVPAVAVAAPPAAPGSTDSLATEIRITFLGDRSFTPPTGVPPGSVPNAYIVKGVPWELDVEFWGPDTSTPDPDDLILAPLSTTSDVALNLTVQNGSQADRAKSWSITVPRSTTSATFATPGQVFAQDWDDAVLKVSTVPPRKKDPTLDASITFDVLIVSGAARAGAALTSITRAGAGTTPCSPTTADPVCGDLLVNGKAVGDGLLSLGTCDANCRGQLVQVLIGLTATPTEPATLVMKCDKSLCKGGGISTYQLYFTLDAEQEPTQPAPACPAKGVVGANGFCVDYVQSTRDNAGDTFLYLLFTVDAKVRFL